MAAAHITQISTITVNNTTIFYRYAGSTSPSARTILLLHGFPSSSHQFRNLIPQLAARGYRVVAPDLPGFGFTKPAAGFSYTFERLATTVEAFVDGLGLRKFALFVFDYGAPTGFRLAVRRPESVLALVSQNGNAYEEGFGSEFWKPLRQYWESGKAEDRDALRPALELDVTRAQYTNGSPHPERIPPESYTLDQALMDRPGNKEIQLNLFYDYRTNVPLYPKFQEYFRTSQVPVLAIWGKNDEIFVEAGAEAFRRDVANLEVRLLDAGHFALEGNEEVVAEEMDAFFENYSVFGEN